MDYLLEAFRQSYFAIGNSDPNPPVGAVLVSDTGEILGKGYTQPYGGPHAEVMAITNALKNYPQEILSRATLYVTLEPCSHFGKTPPCTNLIIQYKIPKVVIASRDQSEKVTGIKLLEENNVDVIVVENYSEELLWTIDSFHFHLENHRPRIWLKWAQTDDGFLGPLEGPSGAITGGAFKEFVFRLRKLFNGILATPGTVKTDYPQLTPRYGNMSLDGLAIPGALDDIIKTFEINYPESSRQYQNRFFLMPDIEVPEVQRFNDFINLQKKLNGNVHFLGSRNSKLEIENPDFTDRLDFNNIGEIISYITTKGCLNLMVEAGAGYCDKFIKSGYVDFIIAAKSSSQIWQSGKSFSLSQSLSKNNFMEFEKLSFSKLYEFTLENDTVYIFKKNH